MERPYNVYNPTHEQFSQAQWQQLRTLVPSNKFEIMYIYAMELRKNDWSWVVVLSQPYLPFILTEKKYKQVQRFFRHPEHGWIGLVSSKERICLAHTMRPPLQNPLYENYGYTPGCSPYLPHRSSSEGHASENHASEENSSEENTPKASINSSPDENAAKENAPDGQAKSSSKTQLNTALDTQVISSDVAAIRSALDEEQPRIFSPDRANPPQPIAPVTQDHNGHRNPHTDLSNTTIFVGGLRKEMTEDQLAHLFERFGELYHVKKKSRKGEETTCGFVQFADRQVAEMALSQMQGYPVGGIRLRLSWGTDPTKVMDRKGKYWEAYRQAAWRAYETSGPHNDPKYWTS
ncbi:hypothetical protein diail_11025 [Diaporthe ilicicola]|nr:hypothetical protein diail_11025 [Diaporthe ilicicola]